MTLPGQVTFDNEEEREDWIKGRTRGFSDVYPTSDQLRGDLELLFAKELFGYGPARGVNMTELMKVLGENRDRLLPGPQADDARRAVAFDDKVGTHRPRE